MSVERVNNHVLFASCNWSLRPEWARRWQTESVPAVAGQQSRLALRAVARHELSFSITPRDGIESARLDDAIREAKKFGRACAPFWGRGCQLTAAVASATVTCLLGWDWQAGDHAFLQSGDSHAVELVEAAVLDAGVWTLTLADAVTAPQAGFVRPLIFGVFNCSEVTAKSPRHGPVQISIRELTNARSVQIGETPVAVAGIGTIELEDDFQIA
jgi:hypothetical protein